MDKEKLEQVILSANEYVDDLKNHPEKRMESVHVGDKVFFLKPDAEKDELWNCGYAEVMGVENRDGVQKGACKVKDVENLFLKSESYPFSVYAELKHILVNYTDKTRQEKKKESEDGQ